jgi:hypothetical protein
MLQQNFTEQEFIDIVSDKRLDALFTFEKGYYRSIAESLFKEFPTESQRSILKCLNFFSSLYMEEDDVKNPYGIEGKRFFLPKDVDKDFALFLFNHLGNISNLALKTRIADVLWVIKLLESKNNIKAAEIAVDGFYFCIDKLIKNGNLHLASNYLQRLCNLLLSMRGNRKLLWKKLTGYADAPHSDDNNNIGSLDWWNRLLDNLAELGCFDETIYQKNYEKTLDIIKSLSEEKSLDFDWIRRFYDIALKFANGLKLDKKTKEALQIDKITTYEKEAARYPSSASSELKRDLLKKALFEYQEMPNHKSDIERLTLEIEKMPTDMSCYTTFSQDIDISFEINEAKLRVAGKNFDEAIYELVLLFSEICMSSLNKEKETEKAQRLKAKSPFRYHLHVIRNDCEFKTEDEILNYHIMESVIRQNGLYFCILREAITQINFDSHYQLRDIVNLVSKSPFVPENHKYIIAKGIKAFLEDDMIGAGHLLILQFENCLRYLLWPTYITSKIDESKGEESLTSIDNLLKKCVEAKIFNTDIAWFFEIYLVSKLVNLRNSIAHGKLADDDYYHFSIGIVCVGIMWLVLLPKAKNYKETLSNA